MAPDNEQVTIYRNAILDLAETIHIKSSYAAKKINDLLNVTHPGSFTADPRTWKYYLNLSGQYHQSDTPMEIISLDTLEPILFSKDNLALHRATARAYSYGTRLYRELLLKYPHQEELILGIIHPANIEDAIKAPEHTIVSYAPYLVEENEYTLIRDLSKWSQAFFKRNYVGAYNLSDDLYLASIYGVLGPKLAEQIFTERLKRMRSDEVHSFFVRAYLASNGYLDRYFDILTFKQKLWLYRNLPWIRRNPGRTENYEWLIENILSERSVPLMAYAMKHESVDIENNILSTPRFQPTARNTYVNEADMKDRSLMEILYMEDPLASGNAETRINQYDEIYAKFEHSVSHKVSTKVLQSIMTDYADSEAYTFSDTLLNHWVYLSEIGIFGSVVPITNPQTGVVTPLPAKDAFIISLYLLLVMQGYEPTIIPPITVSRVQRIIRPSIEELKSVVDKELVSEDEIRDLIKYQPELIPIVSIEAFHDKCFEIYTSILYQSIVVANTHERERRGYLQNAANLVYGTKECILTDPPNQYFHEWFDDRQLVIDDYLEDPEQSYKDIMEASLGLNLTQRTTIADIQAAMLNIVGQHISYSTQLVRTSLDAQMKYIGMSDLRFTNPKQFGRGKLGQFNMEIEVAQRYGHSKIRLDIEDWLDANIVDVRGSFKDMLCINVDDILDVDLKPTPQTYKAQLGIGVTISGVEPPVIGGKVPLPGDHLYATLTEEQRQSIPDPYIEA